MNRTTITKLFDETCDAIRDWMHILTVVTYVSKKSRCPLWRLYTSYRMNPHDRLRSVLAEAHQEWQAFAYDMQSHENHYITRAGVSGIRGALAVIC